MKIYLAGKMRGKRDFNFPAFFKAARKLREQGHEVFNPAEADIEKYGSLKKIAKAYKKNKQTVMRDVIRKDLIWIIKNAEAIAILPGWKGSKGVAAEKALAKFLGIKLIYLKKDK